MLKAFFNLFKPSYSVVVTTYHVIPGFPLNKNLHKHDFGKGAFDEAKAFYDKVVKKTGEIKLAPVEINLLKGKSTIVESQKFGPVDQVKKLK
ncbi:MAG: hypothetical protein ACFHWX_13515 [Bacteroidota bacterium]